MEPGDNEIQRAILWANTRLQEMDPAAILAVHDAVTISRQQWLSFVGAVGIIYQAGLLTPPERKLLNRIHTTYPTASISERYVYLTAIIEGLTVVRRG